MSGESFEAAVAATLTRELEDRDAGAFVHVGSIREPAVRYCVAAADDEPSTGDVGSATFGEYPGARASHTYAVAFDVDATDDDATWHLESSDPRSSRSRPQHPAVRVAERLTTSATVLAPPHLPHDAALYFEERGLELASSDVIDRARTTKHADERSALEAAQTAAATGIARVRALVASTDDDVEGSADTRLTTARLDRALSQGVLEGGALPIDTTIDASVVEGECGASDGGETDARDHPIPYTAPVVVATTVRTPEGYHGRLARTLVVDPDGGAVRRAHVALTHAFRSVRAMATADDHPVRALEADLEAEIRAFGFDEADGITARVDGIGLEASERPTRGDDVLAAGGVACVDARIDTASGTVRLADLLVKAGAEDGGEARSLWVAPPSRSVRPDADG